MGGGGAVYDALFALTSIGRDLKPYAPVHLATSGTIATDDVMVTVPPPLAW